MGRARRLKDAYAPACIDETGFRIRQAKNAWKAETKTGHVADESAPQKRSATKKSLPGLLKSTPIQKGGPRSSKT
jgi:hypothetical protein